MIKNFITISNKSKKIESTNYWESDLARSGYFFVTGNAGCLRVLVPKKHENYIEEMRTAKRVLIEPSLLHDPKKVLDFVFDDETDAPFTLSISKEQMGLNLRPGRWTVMIISQKGKQLELEGLAKI